MAAAHRLWSVDLTAYDDIERRPTDGLDVRAIGYLNYLRRLERRGHDVPRIGTNVSLQEEVVSIGQDPSMAFPEADIKRIDTDKRGKPAVRNQIIGFFGGQGALPLHLTEEVYRWVLNGDMGFVHFTDIFATRFQQLFFRVWSDAQAITQFDHAGNDRFAIYIGSLLGIGNPANQNRDQLHDINKIALAPLALGRIKSPVKLRQMLKKDLGARFTIEEFVPTWVEFEPDSRNALGMAGSTLGRDMFLGGRTQTVQDKIMLTVATKSLQEYRSYLPGGESHRRMKAIVAWYLGVSVDVDVALTLPANAVEHAALGKSAALGWMAALPPAKPPPSSTSVAGATYALGAAA